jgi:hypothetical protein
MRHIEPLCCDVWGQQNVGTKWKQGGKSWILFRNFRITLSIHKASEVGNFDFGANRVTCLIFAYLYSVLPFITISLPDFQPCYGRFLGGKWSEHKNQKSEIQKSKNRKSIIY